MNTITLRRTSGRFAAVLLSTFSVAGLAATGNIAQASTLAETEAGIVVNFDDLSLSTPRGVETLYARIAAAARLACPDVDSRELPRLMAGKSCQRAAIARAVQSLNIAPLAAVYSERSHRG